MRHVLIGGDGFVGRTLARDLADLDEHVVIADIQKTAPNIYDDVEFVNLDITDPLAIEAFHLEPDDMVYNLSAKMLSPIMPRAKRHDFFWPVNYHGVVSLLKRMEDVGCSRLVHFTTDMVYGHTKTTPTLEDHPTEPLGEYGLSKLATEVLCESYRKRGMYISIFRPRLIIGPGRLGILSKLFRLIDLNLPVPLIGSGKNPYQFISVYDCASAARLAWSSGVPNGTYNLGSNNPPSVKTLLRLLIKESGSHSILLPVPAPLVKLTLDAFDSINLPLMDPEQYKIANEVCILDTTAAHQDIGWQPKFCDEDMLLAAYWAYRAAQGDKRAPEQQLKLGLPSGESA